MKSRNSFLVGLYSLLSLGIYFLFWTWQLHKSLKIKGYRLFPFVFFGIPYLLFFVVVYYIFGLAIFQGTQDDIGLVLVFFLYYAFMVLLGLLATFGLAWQIRFSRALRQETSGLISLKTNLIAFYLSNLLMAIFLPAIIFWPIIIQHKINRYLFNAATPPAGVDLDNTARGVSYSGS